MQLLNQLQLHQGALLGLLTGNIRQGAFDKLKHYGLADRFSFGGFGDAHDERCDIAATALVAAQRAAARHGNGEVQANRRLSGVMVIGDTVHDVSCARSIGAYAVAVLTGNAPAEQLAAAKPDLLLRDLSDPGPLLEIVLSAHNAQ
jgi:phosphoglycolate phosphatase-like HAD superfamily hydrolase